MTTTAQAQQYLLQEKKLVVRPDLNLNDGVYGVIQSINKNGEFVAQWVHCRDQFQNYDISKYGMLFVHPANATASIARFINIIESEKLRHQKVTVFSPTNLPKVSWLKPADFWLFATPNRGPIRKSFFSALLRAAMKYDPTTNNFDDALFSIEYTRYTKPAVIRFLEGYTWISPTGDMHNGWYAMFRNAKEDAVSKMLSKKPVSKIELLQFLLGRLQIKSPEIFQEAIDKEEATDTSLLGHALELLNMTKQKVIESYKGKRKSLRSMMQESLKRLDLTEDEAIAAFKKSKKKLTTAKVLPKREKRKVKMKASKSKSIKIPKPRRRA